MNISEYLPTTEATGIKLTIHEKTAFPFPDTFGYNAPVGYQSSFGIRMVREVVLEVLSLCLRIFSAK